MHVDRRTFIIVVIIIAVALPIIIFVFRKSFFPIMLSLKEGFISAGLSSSTTGVPMQIMDLFR